jgi:hypothetical protein
MVRRTAKSLALAENCTSDHPACSRATYKQLSFGNEPAIPQHRATQYHNQLTAVYCITVTTFLIQQQLQLLTSTCFFLLALGFLSSTVPPGFRFRSSFFAASFFFLFSSYSEIRSGQSRFSSGSHVLSSLLNRNEQSC